MADAEEAPVEDAPAEEPAAEEEAAPEEPPFTITLALTAASALWEVPPSEDEEKPADPAVASVSVTFPGQEEPVETEPVTAGEDGTFAFALEKAFEVEPGVPLLQTLLTPACATVYDCAGGGKVAKGTVTLDLTPLVQGAASVGGEALAVQPLPVEGSEEEMAALAGGASVALTVAPAAPLVTAEEAAAGAIMELKCESISGLPAALVAASEANGEPFTFTGAVAMDTGAVLSAGGALTAGEVAWAGAAGRVYLDGPTAAKLKAELKKAKPVTMELARYLKPEVEGSGDSNAEAYRCSAALCLSQLLEPGVSTSTVTAALVAPVAEDTAAAGLPPLPTEGKPLAEDAPEGLGMAGASVTATVSLSRPLLAPWAPPPKPELLLKDLLPVREPLPKAEPPKAAAEGFREEVLAAAAKLAAEYGRLFQGAPSGEEEKEARRRGLVFDLNRSGKYFALKDGLKAAVAKLVKERFHAQGASPEERAGMYNQLYVLLVDEMHAALKSLGMPPPPPPAGPDMAELARLKGLAGEYELAMEAATADRYHKERVLMAKGLPAVWLDYGEYLLRAGDHGQAEETLKEAVALDKSFVPGFAALCALLTEAGERDRAEVYGQAVTAADPEGPLGWALLSVLYGATGREQEQEHCAWEAERLGAGGAGFLAAAELCASYRLPATCAAALAACPEGVEAALCECKLKVVEKDTEGAVAACEKALASSVGDARALEAMGDAYDAAGELPKAVECYTKALAVAQGQCGRELYTRCARDLHALGDYAEMGKVAIAGCGVAPCASLWLQAGIAFYQTGDLASAEEALAEANLLDNFNPLVWGLLTLTVLKAGRVDEASHAFGQALKQGLASPEVLSEIGGLYYAAGRYRYAEGALRRALKANQEDPESRTLLAETMYDQNELDSAKEEFRLAVACAEGELKERCLRRLADVHKELNEETEAASCLEQIAHVAVEA